MVESVSSTASSSAMASSRQSIAEDFDTFLSILTTQLKNQNPLDPMDTNQFTQQLVQFTGVEQQLKTNEYLEAMMLSSQNQINSQAVNYVGQTVVASGATTDLIDGKATWIYKVAEASEDVTVTIKDQSGNVVYSQETSMKAGTDQIVWDGTTNSGAVLTSGKYTITIDARDADGKAIDVTTKMKGVVESVDVSGTEPYLIVNGLRLPLSSITEIGNTESTDDAAA
ncbi:flagellar hook assembly protein FlgD [Pelagibacterium halotolerans]|uniref:flagellar hook assembly protein FlgD n=1 Tax=Pelagibacterium halotolerans TaxID=531813 RepID=UPI00385157EE